METTFHQAVCGRPSMTAVVLNGPTVVRILSDPATATRFEGESPAHTVTVVTPAPSVSSVAETVAVWCKTVAEAAGLRTDPASVSNAAGIVAS